MTGIDEKSQVIEPRNPSCLDGLNRRHLEFLGREFGLGRVTTYTFWSDVIWHFCHQPADVNVASISPGETASGILPTSASMDYYTLTLADATAIAIDLSSTEFDALLELYETDNPLDADFSTFLSVDDDGGGGLDSHISRVLPAGTYLLAAKSFGGSGVYTIAVSEETFDTQSVAIGEAIGGALLTPADVIFYTLELGDDATVAIDPRSGEFDAFLTLFETDTPLGADFSTFLASDDDGGLGFDSRIVRALSTGTYLVAVSALSGSGEYALELSEEVLQVATLALGESRSGILESSSDTHYLTLDLTEGTAIVIDLTSDEMDPFLELFNTDDPLAADFLTQLSADDDGGDGLNSRIEVALPPGTYLIGVSPIGESGGSYTLTVSEADVGVSTISIGGTLTGSLSDPEDVSYVTLRLDAATLVAIDLASDEFDTFLEVFATDRPADAGFFNLLAQNDDGGGELNSRVVLTLAQGTYLIAAQSFDGSGAFALTLTETVQQLNTAVVGESQVGELLADLDRDFYTLSVTEKTTVTIDLTSDQFDAFVELFGTDNALEADPSTLLAVDDDGGDGLNSRLTFSLSEGTYLIGVSSFSGLGTYTLSVTEAESQLLAVALDGAVSGDLVSLTSVDFYLLSFDEGTSVVIDLSSEVFDAFLELYQAGNLFDATDANRVAIDDDGGEGFNSQIQAALGAGAYVIAVSSLDNPGGYTLSIAGGGSVPITPIALGETVSASLPLETDVIFYSFSLDTETGVTIDVGSDEFDTFLELGRGDDPFQVDANDVLAEDDDGGEGLNSSINIPLQPGTYLLAVSSFSGAGTFDLQITGQTGAVGPNARAVVTLDFEASGSVNLIDDGVTTGAVSGEGSAVLFELFVKPIGRTITGAAFVLDFENTLLEFVDFKPATGLSAAGPSTSGMIEISAAEGGVLLDEGFFGSVSLTTLSDVAGRQLSVGISEFVLTDEVSGVTDILRVGGQLTFNTFSRATVVSGGGPVGPVALDLDPITGDQGQRTSSNRPSVGDVITVELAATEGALSSVGLLVALQFDGKALTYQNFSPSGFFEGALVIPKSQEGSVEINLAFIGGNSASGDMGRIGVFSFVVQEGFSDSSVVQIARGQFARSTGLETMQIGSGGAFVVVGGGSSAGPAGVGPIALDGDLQIGDQGNRSLPAPAAGNEIAIDLVATEGVQGASGALVSFRYDDKALSFVAFTPSDLFAGALVIPKTQPGSVELNIVLTGETKVAGDAGSIGTISLAVLDGLEGSSEVVLTRGAYALLEGISSLSVGADGATLTVGVDAGGALTPDFDGNGTVGFGDFLEFAIVFGSAAGDGRFEARFDLDENGSIGFADFVAFAGAFGSSI